MKHGSARSIFNLGFVCMAACSSSHGPSEAQTALQVDAMRCMATCDQAKAHCQDACSDGQCRGDCSKAFDTCRLRCGGEEVDAGATAVSTHDPSPSVGIVPQNRAMNGDAGTRGNGTAADGGNGAAGVDGASGRGGRGGAGGAGGASGASGAGGAGGASGFGAGGDSGEGGFGAGGDSGFGAGGEGGFGAGGEGGFGAAGEGGFGAAGEGGFGEAGFGVAGRNFPLPFAGVSPPAAGEGF
jgi:hypothetical protein